MPLLLQYARRMTSADSEMVVSAAASNTARGGGAEKAHSHIDTLVALVLSIAAVATAWSAYQSTRWSGIMAGDYNRAAALRTQAVQENTAAGQTMIIDVTLASDWATAQLSGNQPLADALRGRMPGQLASAMDAWLSGWQSGQPLPPGSPFTDQRYVAPGRDQAAELDDQASRTFAHGALANQRSDNYVLTGVLFALALFFAGISSQIESERHTRRIVYASAVLMVAGIILLVLQPKSFSI
ncbi:MAG: hypothetical protein AB7P33_10075 [Dehalococcoidia bacterium]